MKVGIISDTHGFLDPRVAEIFRGVDHILHAGDVGPPELLAELQTVAPVTAVVGNTDMFITLKLTEYARLDGRKFMVHHILDPLALSDELKEQINTARPDAVVYGHTHVRFYGQRNGVMYLNPGYAGRPKYNQERSVAIVDTASKIMVAEFHDL